MNSIVRVDLLNMVIDNQRKAIVYRLIFASVIIFIGLLVIITGFFGFGLESTESFKTILSIGGGFVSSLSSFQFKEIIQRKQKIGILKVLFRYIHNSKRENQGTSGNVEQDRLKEMFWKIIEKDATG